MTDTMERTGAEDVRWRLEEMFSSPDDPEIERIHTEGLAFARDFESRYRGRIAGLTSPEFVEMMRALEAHHDQVARPALYASLLHSLDTRDHAAGRLVGRVHDAGAERGKHLVFFGLEVAALDDAQVERLFTDPAAATFRHTVEQERRERPHHLSDVEERLLTEVSPVGAGAWGRLFGELTAMITAPVDGEEVPLSNALSMIRDPSRDLRRRATLGVTEGLRRDIRTRAYIFNVLLQNKAIFDRVRRYPSWISARNLANETSDEAVQALVDAVTSRYGVVARYYRVKRRLMGLDELYEWDRYAPVEDADRRIDWAGARDLVLDSYSHFSPRAGNLVRDFFDRSWIDAPVSEGKGSGAFCAAATPGFHPFILMNFTGRLSDALTLAHELGHGLHDRLAAGNNLFDYHPPLTLAETASVFGEQLVFDRLMAEETDPRVRLAMLCSQVEDSFATIFRQVAMNRFEDAVHKARREQGELSVDQFGELWQQSIQRMFGDSVTLTDDHRAWWSYVGHYVQSPGYVYAYAFGNLLALSIYRRYREAGEDFVGSYLDFLALGGSRAPHEAVRTVGLDIEDPGFWSAGLDIVEGMVAEVERLAG